MAYDDRPNDYQDALAKIQETVDLSLSLGTWIKKDGAVTDVVVGSPAWQAGFGPGMKVVAVDAVKWSPEAAAAALQAATHRAAPIAVTVEQGDELRVLQIDYHAGERHPHLERDATHPDLLQAILAPKRPRVGATLLPITAPRAQGARFGLSGRWQLWQALGTSWTATAPRAARGWSSGRP